MGGPIAAVVRVASQPGADPIPTVDAAANTLMSAAATQDAMQHSAVIAEFDETHFWLSELDAAMDAIRTTDVLGDGGIRIIIPDDVGQQQQLHLVAATQALKVTEVGEFPGGYFDITTASAVAANAGAATVVLALYNRLAGDPPGEGGDGKNLRVITALAEYHYKATYNGVFASGWYRFTGRPTGGTLITPPGRRSEIWGTSEVRQAPTGGFVIGPPIAVRWAAGTNISGGVSQTAIATQPPVAYHLLEPGQGMLLQCDAATANLLIDGYMVVLQE